LAHGAALLLALSLSAETPIDFEAQIDFAAYAAQARREVPARAEAMRMLGPPPEGSPLLSPIRLPAELEPIDDR
jgi:hypothetical protein